GLCVYCNHCLPCPKGIDVGKVNSLTASSQYGMTDTLKEAYRLLKHKASECMGCKACEKRCPFDVHVVERMKSAVECFEKEMPQADRPH
ncbi:MAG: 4Fe-4S dicluster domain-containing protein, partial [Clostridia bacterium]|nr:4Fe-4S dicluster domain-containing protein [Clostridia bacterium]